MFQKYSIFKALIALRTDLMRALPTKVIIFDFCNNFKQSDTILGKRLEIFECFRILDDKFH